MPHLIRIQCAHRHLTLSFSHSHSTYLVQTNGLQTNTNARDKVAMKYNDSKSLLCSFGFFYSLSHSFYKSPSITTLLLLLGWLSTFFLPLSLLYITIWQAWTFDGREKTEKKNTTKMSRKCNRVRWNERWRKYRMLFNL